MDRAFYSFLKWTAIAMACLWVGWSIYDSFFRVRNAGDSAFLEGETLFEDGYYERALAKYDASLTEAPDHIFSMRARARALMQLQRYEEAEKQFDRVIALDPEFAAAYANRGILHDRMGEYRKAIEDYQRALAIDPEIAEGPHWLTRFLRLQPEKPPTIDDRARYLSEQLAKPPSERLLRIPEIDAEQRSYKR